MIKLRPVAMRVFLADCCMQLRGGNACIACLCARHAEHPHGALAPGAFTWKLAA